MKTPVLLSSVKTRAVSDSAIRKRAARAGYRVVKSRRYDPAHGDHGKFMLLDTATNLPAFGHYHDADLGEIADYLGN